MTDLERDICARAKTIRESINWSQAAFAEQLAITRDQLASIECGRTPLRYDIAWRLRAAFGISLRWLEEGDRLPDDFKHDDLPIPTATNLPPRALLSTVAQKFDKWGGKTLLAIGPESDPAAQAKGSAPNLVTLGPPFELPEEAERIISGRETETGTTDIAHRVIHEAVLKGSVELWIARVPLGHVEAFSSELCRAAESFLKSLAPEPGNVADQRGEEIMWDRIRSANARNILVAGRGKKRVLTQSSLKSISAPMLTLDQLVHNLKVRCRERGKKAVLARKLGVPAARVSEWLSGQKEPGGETTLRLLRWVEQQERQQNTLGSAINTTKGKVTRRQNSYETKPSSSRKTE